MCGKCDKQLPLADRLVVTTNGFHCLVDGIVVEGIMHVLAIAVGLYQLGIPQNAQVLGGNRLLQFQGIVDLVDVDRLILVDEIQDL